MISNKTKRNVCLMFAIALLCGLIYCTYDAIRQDTSWISLTTILTSTAIFFKFYLSYRKAVKQGNIYGKVNPFL